MRKAICWVLWMSLVGWAWGQQASNNSDTVPTVIRFSGNLAGANGKPLSGMVGVTFSLYQQEQGGAPLWVETQNVQPDKTGHYAVTLGSTTTQGLPQAIFASGEARWMGVQPQGQAEQPRVLLMSVPYALKAGDAETVGGLPASAFLAASSASGTGAKAGSNQPPVSGGGKPGFIASWKTATQLTNSKLFQSTAGNIGIGTVKPAANFDVNGSEIVRNTLTLFPNGSAPTLTVNGTAFNVSNTGLVSFVSGQTFPGTGTITGIGTASGSGLMGGGTSGSLNLSLTNVCASGQVLSWNGSAWACTTISGSGTITGVTAGTDLTGGGTSGNVTLNLDTTKVPQLGTPNIFAGTQTVGTGDLLINTGNLDLPQTASATSGVITLGGAPFISACCSSTSFNTFVGTGAGNFNTQNSDNTAVGYQALTNNTGNTNTAVGGTALTGNTTGNSNTAVGTSSLQINTQGGSNTAVGAGALGSNGLGSSNTALGSGAGHSNTGGSNNTFVGQAADAGSQTLTNATAIGSAAIVNESNALVLGAPGVNVGINTPTPAYALDVHGTGNFTGAVAFSSSQTFPNTISGVTTAAGSGLTGGGTSGTLNLSLTKACSSGQVLTWSGSAWACTGLSGGGTITGVTAGTDLTGGGTSGNVTLNLDTTKVPQLNANNSFTGNQGVTGNVSATGTVGGGVVNATTTFTLGGNAFAFGSYSNTNVFLGFSGNSGITGGHNTATGYLALSADTNGASNTADGAYALAANTGQYNTAAGAYALTTNSSGPANTANGFSALQYNTTGAGNTASGADALSSNSTGSSNTATGYEALAANKVSGNTADGYQALYSNTTGQYNTASGYQALSSNTVGNNNTGNGYQALSSNTTASYNNASGYQALYSNTTGYYNSASGHQALYSNSTGGSNAASGYGTLHSNTTGSYNAADGSDALSGNTTGSYNTANGFSALGSNTTGSSNTALGYFADVGNPNLTNATAIGSRALVSESNALVLGGTGSYAVEVGIGTATPDHVFTIAQNAGHAIADGWDTYSSRRWKTNIHTLHGALRKVEQLRGVSYNLKDSGKREVGVIAEEVGAVVPEIVSWDKNGKDAQGVDYSRLTALLIEATKEQQREFRKEQAELARALRQIRQQQSLLRAQAAAMLNLTAEVRETRETLRNVKAQVAAAQPALVAVK